MRAKILAKISDREKGGEQNTVAVDAVHSLLDGNGDRKVKVNDAEELLKKIDVDLDNQVSKAELKKFTKKFADPVYQLCYENAFYDPEKWIEENLPEEDEQGGLFGMLDLEESGFVGIEQLSGLYKMMDVDFDDTVERAEMVRWFNNNQATLCKPNY